jgi:hypothetical protein
MRDALINAGQWALGGFMFYAASKTLTSLPPRLDRWLWGRKGDDGDDSKR